MFLKKKPTINALRLNCSVPYKGLNLDWNIIFMTKANTQLQGSGFLPCFNPQINLLFLDLNILNQENVGKIKMNQWLNINGTIVYIYCKINKWQCN